MTEMTTHMNDPRPVPNPIVLGGPCPWGTIETLTFLADGITFVSSQSHGGFHLSIPRLIAVPRAWRKVRWGATSELMSPWFEEDCDWSMVALIHRDAFPAKAIEDAKLIFKATKAKKLPAAEWEGLV